jgi:hypothetical protein
MRRLIGPSIAITAALAAAVGTVVPFFNGVSVLERERRYDVFVLLLCGAILVLAVLEISRSSRPTRQALLAASAVLFGVTSYWLVELSANTGAGQWLYAAAAIIAAAAAVLLVFDEVSPPGVAVARVPAAPIVATLAAPALVPAAAPPPVPVTPVTPVTPSGFYANPDQTPTQRYWDANLRQWTDLVREPDGEPQA